MGIKLPTASEPVHQSDYQLPSSLMTFSKKRARTGAGDASRHPDVHAGPHDIAETGQDLEPVVFGEVGFGLGMGGESGSFADVSAGEL